MSQPSVQNVLFIYSSGWCFHEKLSSSSSWFLGLYIHRILRLSSSFWHNIYPDPSVISMWKCRKYREFTICCIYVKVLPIDHDEVKKATDKFLHSKVPGADAISEEVFKIGGQQTHCEVNWAVQHHVVARTYPSRLKGCTAGPPAQEERKSSMLW